MQDNNSQHNNQFETDENWRAAWHSETVVSLLITLEENDKTETWGHQAVVSKLFLKSLQGFKIN